MSSGRYHHHVGSNVWHSAGAGRRDEDRAGLAWFAMEGDAAALAAVRKRLTGANIATEDTAAGLQARDPWGTRVRFTKAG